MALRRTVSSMRVRSLLLTSLLVAALPAGCVGPSAVYEGEVVDSAGVAVADAVVSAWKSERIYRDIPGTARCIGRSVTGPDGSWRLALPPDEDRSWLALVAALTLGVQMVYSLTNVAGRTILYSFHHLTRMSHISFSGTSDTTIAAVASQIRAQEAVAHVLPENGLRIQIPQSRQTFLSSCSSKSTTILESKPR